MSIKKTFRRTVDGGFSLIELLLVMVLVPVVFFAVYSNFTAGLKIWAHVTRATPEEDIDIFCVKARRDLQNMLLFASVPFTGEKEEVAFAAAIDARPELGGGHGIGRVRLFYDADHHAIVREVKDYSQLHRDADGVRNVLLPHVASFELSYLSQESPQKDYQWNDTPGEKPPAAVRFSFTIDGVPGTQQRTVFIPVGPQSS